ncbi:MAG: hypothetical protein AVDCRST_MAG58-248 [uncultured Rubrobacteraceae bacterium]|uniref:Uncharacterized protein n=1 Tax=uncultured Rubrobacteraceae bacterium TaxID=349277 RepID=A0A6J4QJX5_9ACTN|nr:MAG: hypothetical protein AVDCRST_MAG58-248 [uncultured Rubrobacteraceae bacterium]
MPGLSRHLTGRSNHTLSGSVEELLVSYQGTQSTDSSDARASKELDPAEKPGPG